MYNHDAGFKYSFSMLFVTYGKSYVLIWKYGNTYSPSNKHRRASSDYSELPVECNYSPMAQLQQ